MPYDICRHYCCGSNNSLLSIIENDVRKYENVNKNLLRVTYPDVGFLFIYTKMYFSKISGISYNTLKGNTKNSSEIDLQLRLKIC